MLGVARKLSSTRFEVASPTVFLKKLFFFIQDIAAEQSTMSYRAPELFDVKTGQTLDEKVDIWVGLFIISLQSF